MTDVQDVSIFFVDRIEMIGITNSQFYFDQMATQDCIIHSSPQYVPLSSLNPIHKIHNKIDKISHDNSSLR